jgi:allophanate hydrolase subunit 2
VDQPQARPVWAAFGVRAGQQLEIGALTRGTRLYLAVQGGIAVDRPLGSASTHRPSKLGPALVGRGAQIRACTHPDPGRFHPLRRLFASVHLEAWREAQQAGHIDLRMTPGPDFQSLTDETAALLTASVFAVHPDSDRIALRFTGPALTLRADPPSRALPIGAVQVDPKGALFIMGVDAPTTGNYPILGSVISADLWKIGQRRAGDAARLRFITQPEAEQAMRLQEEWLASVLAKPK